MQKSFCWQRLHWPEYGAELLGTAFLVFIAISAVTLTFGSGSPLAAVLPNSSARRLIAGLILATSGPSVSLSPLGKLSGAHLNPALSLAFWLQGKMHPHDLVSYLGSQLLGAVLGAGVPRLPWRGFRMECACQYPRKLALSYYSRGEGSIAAGRRRNICP